MLQRIKNIWQGRFRYGASIVGAAFSLNRFEGGQFKINLTLGQILSTNTGHWPFSIFDFVYVTGERSCFHLSVCGLTIGTKWFPDVTVDQSTGGTTHLDGPDYRRYYVMISCINHQFKQLEEIL